MPLTDTKVRNSKAEEKQIKLFDSGGLFLLISPKGPKTPNGSKCWRMKYRIDGKEKLLALGTYPEISLADARERRDAARKLVANGIDPGQAKKAQKTARADAAANSFEVIAREWHGKYLHTWTPKYAARILDRLEKDALPWIGARPISDLKAPDVLAILRRVEFRGALESAHKLKIIIGQVFRYAVATGRAERDPTGDLKGALPPQTVKHLAALTDPKDVAPLLRAIDGYQGSFVVKCALRLAPLVFVRPGELRQAEWSEIDLEASEWNIPGHKMKMKNSHIVPLSRQAVEILGELKPLTGASRYVFPSGRSFARAMSENAVNAALRRMG